MARAAHGGKAAYNRRRAGGAAGDLSLPIVVQRLFGGARSPAKRPALPIALAAA
jgi:hypothetical protein